MRVKSHIGIDIGTAAVKGIELIQTSKGVKILSAAMEKLPIGAPTNVLLDKIRLLLSNLAISHNQLNVSVAGKNVIARYLLFPVLPKQNIIKSLKFEFDKYIPFPMDDSIVDIDILGKTADAKKMNVLVVAARKEVVKERLKIIEELHLIPDTITTDSLALSTIFLNSSYNNKELSYILLNIGNKRTNLAIVKKGIPVFSRDIEVGGEALTRIIADKAGVTLEKAEEEKCLLPAERIEIFSDLYALINEIQLSIEYTKKFYGLEAVENIYICGGTARLNGIAKFLSDATGIACDSWNPFASFEKTKNADFLEQHYLELVLAAGIALA